MRQPTKCHQGMIMKSNDHIDYTVQMRHTIPQIKLEPNSLPKKTMWSM